MTSNDVYQLAYEDLRNGLINQIDSVEKINDRALEVLKFDLAVGVFFLSVVKFFEITQFKHLVIAAFGIISFGYSIWSCIQVLSAREFSTNTGPDLRKWVDPKYGTLVTSPNDYYYYMIEDITGKYYPANDERFKWKADTLNKSLWSSLAGLLFFSAAMLSAQLSSYPIIFDVAITAGIVTTVMWGWERDITEHEDVVDMDTEVEKRFETLESNIADLSSNISNLSNEIRKLINDQSTSQESSESEGAPESGVVIVNAGDWPDSIVRPPPTEGRKFAYSLLDSATSDQPSSRPGPGGGTTYLKAHEVEGLKGAVMIESVSGSEDFLLNISNDIMVGVDAEDLEVSLTDEGRRNIERRLSTSQSMPVDCF